MASWRIRFHDKWPHLASLYASTHNLDEDGKNPDPMMGQDNVFDPSEPYGAYRYYLPPTERSEFSIEEPVYTNHPMYKDEESRSSDYTSGDSFRRGSTCRVLLCVFLVVSFIGVVVAAITLAVILSKTPTPRRTLLGPVEEFESTARLRGQLFNSNLFDNASLDYKTLEKEFCKAIYQIAVEPDSPIKNEYEGCRVVEFSSDGSERVLAKYRIQLKSKNTEGFSMAERIPQKLDVYYHSKVKEQGPWDTLLDQSYKRRFTKIEPPVVTTTAKTTPATETTTIPSTTVEITTSANITTSAKPTLER